MPPTDLPAKRFGDERDWFFQARLGLFVHWGLYAIHGWHEQEQMRRPVRRADYARLIEEFNPAAFEPDAWLDATEQAGFRYLCFTAKHHDGFCLWDTRQSDFKVTQSPCGRDLLGELAEACHRRDMPLCVYYSVVDWHHPAYPQRNASHELPRNEPGDTPDLEAYLDYLREQVRELCTNYGPLHGFWWDMNQTGRTDPSINAMIRRLQPAAVINNRGFDEGDFGTPEREMDPESAEARVFTRPTEACNSVGAESWGFRRDEEYYTSEHLLRQADAALAKGGNYLLNIGPDADGRLPQQGLVRLEAIGRWISRVREAVFGAQPASSRTDNPRVLLTRKDGNLYVHLTDRPITDGVWLRPLDTAPARAVLLNDGREVPWRIEHLPSSFKDPRPQLHLHHLPVDAFGDEVMVVRLEGLN